MNHVVRERRDETNMKKPAVTLEILDKKIETSIASLDKKIDKIDFKFEAKIDALDKKIEANTFEIKQMSLEFVDFVNFMKENVMLRDETKDYIDERVDAKFSNHTWNQLDFQDQVARRCENNEHENLGLHHRVARLEKHVGI